MKASSFLSHLETFPGAAILKLVQCLSHCLVPVQSHTLQLTACRRLLTLCYARHSAEQPHVSPLPACFSWSSPLPPFVLRLVFLEIIGCFLKYSSSAPSFSLVLSVCLNTSVRCFRLDRAGDSAQIQSRSSYFTLWSPLGLCCKSFWGSCSVGTAFLRSLFFLFWVYLKFAEAYFLEVS